MTRAIQFRLGGQGRYINVGKIIGVDKDDKVEVDLVTGKGDSVKLRLSVSTSHSGSSIDLSLDEARQLASTLVKAIERSTDVIAKVAEIERQRAALSERERSEIEELMS